MITINPLGAVIGMSMVALTGILFWHLAHKPEQKNK
jgi:hypothetical protein